MATKTDERRQREQQLHERLQDEKQRRVTIEEKPIDRYLTPKEVAELLKVSTDTVKGWAHSREIDAINIGNGDRRPLFRFTREALEAFLAKRTTPANVPTPPRRRMNRTTKRYF